MNECSFKPLQLRPYSLVLWIGGCSIPESLQAPSPEAALQAWEHLIQTHNPESALASPNAVPRNVSNHELAPAAEITKTTKTILGLREAGRQNGRVVSDLSK